MIRSKKISLKEAQEKIKDKIEINDQENLTDYILNKLEISRKQFDQIINKENKNFKNFLTYFNFIKIFKIFIFVLIKIRVLPKILYLKYFS